MTNDETREWTTRCSSSFGFRHSIGFQVSSFGFKPMKLARAKRILAAALIAAQAAVFPVMAADPVPGAKPADVADVVIDAQTDLTIQGALKYLASKQSPSGAWSEQDHPVAFTGYVLMAFLATGNLPG